MYNYFPHVWQYLIVAVLGFLVGVTELVSRYRDNPGNALLSLASVIYIAVNVCAADGAFYIIRVFDWRFGTDSATSPEGVFLMQAFVAGLGSMAFFRSSLFTVRVGDNDVGIGPSGILQVILSATDRAVDRNRAKPRSSVVVEIMKGISFDKAKSALPAYCFAIMQNLSLEEQTAVGKELATLASSQMEERVKSYILGLTLMNLVGEHVLRSAVDSLRNEIGNETA